MEVTESQPHL